MNVSIVLEGMQFYAYHGCFAEERSIGARFVVDVSIDAQDLPATETDDIRQTIDYAAVYLCVKEVMDEGSALMEHLACRIARRIFAEFERAQSVTVRVSKPNPPLGGQVKQSSITLSLQRGDVADNIAAPTRQRSNSV